MSTLKASADDAVCHEDIRRHEDTLDGADTVDKSPDPDDTRTDSVQKKPRKRRKREQLDGRAAD